MTTTKYDLTQGVDVGNYKAVTVALTNLATTTAEIYIGPYKTGGISNESGGAVVLTPSTVATANGTSLAIKDAAGTAAAALTIADDGWHDLPSYVAGLRYLILTAATGTPSVTLHMTKEFNNA